MIIKRTPVALAIAGVLFSTTTFSASLRDAQPLHVAPQKLTSDISHPLVGPDGKANIVIVLKGDPAARTYGRILRSGGGGSMAKTAANSASRTAVAQLQSTQNTFVKALNASGVKYDELFRMQRVLNGIAVRMRPSDMQKVRNLPNVDHVSYLPVHERPKNIVSVPFIDAPQVWDGVATLGLPFDATGTGVKIGDIDTGLDYVHPDFGGSGLLADYQNIDPTSIIGKNTATPVFPTPKVVGGTDFAGDAYNASNSPVPDPNPMDCGGHGSHTAGTLAGFGVNADGTTYNDPFNATVPYTSNLKIGPGVAPGADLYALRVFGCGGSTSLVTEAIEWATDPNGDGDLSDHLDVINMSLGNSFGVDAGAFDDEIQAVNNAAEVGLVSVSAAGNAGDTFFIIGAPGAANVGITAAASEDPSIPGVVLSETTPSTTGFAATASGYTNPANPQPPAPSGQTGNLVLVNDGSANPTLGCAAPSAGTYAGVSGNFAVIDRGVCNFTVKVLNAQAAGATGVVVVDNSTSPLPGVMGGAAASQINIPGVLINHANGAFLKSQLTGTVSVTMTATTNADTLASFSSRGPVTNATGGIQLKPDVAAPGLNIPSVQTGFTCTSASQGCITPNPTGFIPGGGVLTISGTSMSTPHIAGMVALLKQLNPDATVEELKAMAINGAAHSVTLGADGSLPAYGASRVGAGRVDAASSATGTVLAYNADVAGAVAVTFDVEPVGTSFIASHNVTLANRTNAAQSVTLGLNPVVDAPGINFAVPSGSIFIPANGTATFAVTMTANTSQMNRSLDPTMATTQTGTSSGITLPRSYLAEESSVITVLAGSTELARLPVYAAVRPNSTLATPTDLGVGAPVSGTTNLPITGQDVCTGTISAGPTCAVSLSTGEESLVSPFELQATAPKDPTLPGFANVRDIGINSAPIPGDTELFFGVATDGKWGSPSQVSFNVCVDSDGDGLYDKVLFNTDLGTLDGFFGVPGAEPQDTFVSAIFDNVGFTLGPEFTLNLAGANVADVGTLSNNTMMLVGTAGDLGLTSSKFTYAVAVCPGFNALCGTADWNFGGGQGTANCGTPDSAYATFGPMTYDTAAPGVDGAGNVLLEDLNGQSVVVDYDGDNLAANGSLGMLLLHTHNTAAKSAQVVILDRIFANSFEHH